MSRIIRCLIVFTWFCFFAESCMSQYEINLQEAYNYYKQRYLTNQGRVIDPMKNDITTSEAQSYIMFEALANNDKTSFDLVYNWTKKHLKRKDNLFSWLYGKNKEDKYEVLDYNSASDADVHIARCLVAAYEQWHDEKYLKDAKKIINAIWSRETKIVHGRRILMPGVNQTKSLIVEVNPSYFAPYSFRLFKKYGKFHNWDKLVDSSYYYLDKVMSKTKTGLPPNWFLIENEEIVLENSKRSDFSYDAVRVFWRIYSDYENTKDVRALLILNKSTFFVNQWKKNKNFYTNYTKDGKLRDLNKPIGSIAILIPAISLFNKKVAEEIFDVEIRPKLNKKGVWQNPAEYYQKNLLWFGKYMYVHQHFLE